MKPSLASEMASAADVTAEGLTACERRKLQPLLRSTWSIQALWRRLPFPFPTDPDVPPSAKARYRSQYRYPGPEALLDPAKLAVMTPFEVSLYLIDYSPLEPLLAQRYKPSHKGRVPFHPVSMFLALLLRRELNLSWRGLATLLASNHGVAWRTLCGFQATDTPSASGLRHFLNAIGPAFFAELCERFMDLLFRAALCAQHSTYPGDPPGRGVTISQDGMLHPTRSRPDCPYATDHCYRPIDEHTAPDVPRRLCRARDNGHDGCACNTSDCQARCRRVSTLDPEARFIHYSGHNKGQGKATPGKPSRKESGIDVFGYRSIADRVLDDRFHVAWTIRSTLYPANTDERTVFVEGITQLRQRFPDLKIGEWIDDAAVGYGDCLNAIWDAGALRMVDIRADTGDNDVEACLMRGYDAQGHPLCPHGYRLRSNGYDAKRRRTKFVCRHACRREPRHEGETICPVAGCPYLDNGHGLGYVLNVGRTLPDGSNRLARDVTYGSAEWSARYGRRNHSESRNGQVQGMGLKRMRSHGLERNTKEVQMTDFIVNLRTMGRLLQEASSPPAADRGG